MTSDQDSVSSNDSDDRVKPASVVQRGPMLTGRLSSAMLSSPSLTEGEIAAMFYRPAESADDARAASWFAFLCGRAPIFAEAVDSSDDSRRLLDRLQQSHAALTQQPLDPRIKAYCRDSNDRWAAYFTRQLSSPRGQADAQVSLRSVEVVFDRVREAAKQADVVPSGVAEDAPTHPSYSIDDAVPGDRFPQLMAELHLTDDVHFLYLCSRLVNGTGRDFRAVDDVWCITRRSWRRGWILLDALCPQRQVAVASRLAQEIDSAPLNSPEFQHLYLFLWAFAPSVGTPAPRHVDGSHSPPRKSLPFDDAVEFWQLLVTPARWRYINEWLAFLNDDSTRTHARRSFTSDLWRQFLEFMVAFSTDSVFLNYDPSAASWPSLLDEFVEWKNNRPSDSL